MNTTKAILISVIVSVVVFSLGVGLQAAFNRTTFGTQVQNDLFYFTGGIKVGTTGQFSVSSSGSVSSTANIQAGAVISSSSVLNGGSSQTAQAKVSVWYPQSAIILAPYVGATSTTSTVISFPFGTNQGFAVGDGCLVSFNNAPTSTSFGEDALLWAVGAANSTGTLTVWNGSGNSVTINSTSSLAAGASSTVSLQCEH